MLIGHEDWVHSVAWQPPPAAEAGAGAPRRPCLLSASMDRTMALWRPEAGGAPYIRRPKHAALWTRLGDVIYGMNRLG